MHKGTKNKWNIRHFYSFSVPCDKERPLYPTGLALWAFYSSLQMLKTIMSKHYMEWIRSIQVRPDSQGKVNNPITRSIEPEEEQSIRNAALRFNKTYGLRRNIRVSVHLDWKNRTITIVGRELTDNDESNSIYNKNK